MLVHEEGRFKKLINHFVHLTVYKRSSSKAKTGRKDEKRDNTLIKVVEGVIHKEQRCLLILDPHLHTDAKVIW